MGCVLKTNLDSEARKTLKTLDLSEFDALVELHGHELFQFALRLSILDLAPNELDSYTCDGLVNRLHHYYSNVDQLHGLRLEHGLGL